MMRKRLVQWLRVVFGGAVLLAAGEGACLSDTLREASDDLDRWADRMEGEEDDDLSDFMDDLDDLFD